jgi:hypothetical protein
MEISDCTEGSEREDCKRDFLEEMLEQDRLNVSPQRTFSRGNRWKFSSFFAQSNDVCCQHPSYKIVHPNAAACLRLRLDLRCDSNLCVGDGGANSWRLANFWSVGIDLDVRNRGMCRDLPSKPR